MDRLLTNFIRALRNAEVRISTSETLDALHAVELVGYADRELLKNSLSIVLPKTESEKAAFDVCFEKFFAHHGTANMGVDRAIPSEDVNVDALEPSSPGQGAQTNGGGGGQGNDEQGAVEQGGAAHESAQSSETIAAQSALGKLLMRGDRMDIGMAIASAGEQVGVQNIEVFTQKSVYTRKIMNAMGLPELSDELEQLRQAPDLPQQRLAGELTRRRDWLRERVRDYVEHQFLLHADVTGKRLQEDLLRTIRLSNVDERNLQRMQTLVQRMAKRLVSLYSRRRRVFRRGQLHVPRTLRRNMSYDGAIFDLQWRSNKVDRPKVFVLCDVSGSVADYAKFMLMLLYSLEEVLPKVRSFAFASDLAEVSDLFATLKVQDAIARILHLHGGSTDYGHALADFKALCLDDIDKRSTIIVLGDARNNFGELRSDIVKTLYERCKRLIWLNPEPRSSWDVGDSEMKRYAVYCHQVEECNSLLHLERVVSRLLRSVQ
jgi:uncharacterized protein with von Willebrand factor type A (vWA) domain